MTKQRTCIFCNKKGNITKEHFWPNWLSKYFPKSNDDRYVSEVHEAEAKSPMRLIKRFNRQGHIITKKIRVVCRECNNGWMSSLEAKVKPVIAGLLLGQIYKLNKTQLYDLSLWATVKTIVGEHAEGQTALTPDIDRHLLYKKQHIPDYFRIFIGIHSSDTTAAYSRHSTSLSLSLDRLDPPLTSEVTRNTQIVTFLLGPLVLHVVAVRVFGLHLADEILSSNDLSRIWPIGQDHIDISSLTVIDDEGLRSIHRKLSILLSASVVQYGGPMEKYLSQ